MSQSVLPHPYRLEHVASRVIMGEKSGGDFRIFLRAITSVYISYTRPQHQEARKVNRHLNIWLTSAASVTVTFCILLLDQSFQMAPFLPIIALLKT